MVHELKIYPEFFEAIKAGKKFYEIRKNDRSFKVGDILALNEFIPGGAGAGEYTDRTIFSKISYIFESLDFLKPGFVILSLSECLIVDEKSDNETLRRIKKLMR